jgi:hypothetical protein
LAGVAAVAALLSLVYPGLLIFFMTRRKILPAFEVTAAPPVSTL